MYYKKLLSFACKIYVFIHNLETLWPVVKYSIELFSNAPFSVVRNAKTILSL